jgi:hypothetical protein
MSGLSRLRRLLMVTPAEEKARSLETDEAIMDRKSRAIDVHVWPYVPNFFMNGCQKRGQDTYHHSTIPVFSGITFPCIEKAKEFSPPWFCRIRKWVLVFIPESVSMLSRMRPCLNKLCHGVQENTKGRLGTQLRFDKLHHLILFLLPFPSTKFAAFFFPFAPASSLDEPGESDSDSIAGIYLAN